MATPSNVLKDHELFRTQSYINGIWANASSGETFDVHDPSTGNVLASLPELDEADIQGAIESAHNAFPAWSKVVPRERGRLLRRWYELISQHTIDLATLITLENGKPLHEAESEVKYAADFVEWFSAEAARIGGDTIAASVPGRRVYTIKEPVGVCALITPWNWPAGMVTRKIAPALAAGCTIVLKAPAETPLTSAALAVLASRAGIPSGVINVVNAHSNTSKVGTLLAKSPLVHKLSFTGSTRVGKILMNQAAGTLKKLSFELGGNAPFIVFEDAAIPQATKYALECKFRSSGQTCVCANRIYVQRAVYGEFVEAFVKAVKEYKLGPGLAPDVTHGPLINARSVAKSQEHVKDAIEKGAALLVGGRVATELGPLFYEPTVLGNCNSQMLIAHDETFGPVAGIFPFETEAEVIALANDTEVGLAGYFCSNDVSRCYRVAEALQVGMVGINTGLVSDVAMPFGGIKESGFGREGSKYGISEYQTIKSVTVGVVD